MIPTYKIISIINAKFIFETLEGIDIQYPSAACVAALKQAVKKKEVSPEDSILLHITGGGQRHLQKHKILYPYRPSLRVEKTEIDIAVREISGFLMHINNNSYQRK